MKSKVSLTAIVAATLIPRLLHLDTFLTLDESLWLIRSRDLLFALLGQDWANTFQTGHPGVTTMWGGFLGLWGYGLAQGLVQPTNMELYICNVDGSNLRQITELGGANWAPYFHPSGQKIVFSTNHHKPGGRVFNIFSINLDGSGLEQITFDETFDAFPMFSPDGQKLSKFRGRAVISVYS